jgi:hypothetical protein
MKAATLMLIVLFLKKKSAQTCLSPVDVTQIYVDIFTSGVVHIITLWMNQYVERHEHDILYHWIIIFVRGWDSDQATIAVYSDCLFLIRSSNNSVLN